jgi:hypothetical protein
VQDTLAGSDTEHGRMKLKILFVTLTVLFLGAGALPQVHISSLDAKGTLSWTSSIPKGFYDIESADLSSGSWNLLSTVADLNPAITNPITAQVALTNAQTFYRVTWLRPEPMGAWDYQGYDSQGKLVITGHLTIASMSLLSSNPPVVYGLQGSWDLQYAGPPTNQLGWLGPQIGTGYMTGTMEVDNAYMNLQWPTNILDNNIELLRTALGPNTYTGVWLYWNWMLPSVGAFSAQRR